MLDLLEVGESSSGLGILRQLGDEFYDPIYQVAEWASIIHNFAKTFGLSDSVMTLDDLSRGDDVKGTGEGI